MTYLRSEIIEFVECIWETNLNLCATPAEEGSAAPKSGVRFQCGVVPIDGEFAGAVVIQVEEALALDLACAMMGMPMESLEPEDTQDALGEISNMIAGNIKAILPRPSRLALPVLMSGIDCSVSMPESETVSEVDFECLGSSLRIRVIKRAT